MRLRLALGTSQGGNNPLWSPGKLHSAVWTLLQVVELCLSRNLLFGPGLADTSEQCGWHRPLSVVSERQGSDVSSPTSLCFLLPHGSHARLQLRQLGVKFNRNSGKE